MGPNCPTPVDALAQGVGVGGYARAAVDLYNDNRQGAYDNATSTYAASQFERLIYNRMFGTRGGEVGTIATIGATALDLYCTVRNSLDE